MNDFLNNEEDELFQDLVSFIEAEEMKSIDKEREDSSSKFLVYNDRSANFFLGKINDLNEKITEVKKTADEEKARMVQKIDTWRDNKLKPLQGYLDYITAGLEDYLRRENESSNNETKKIKLYNGEIKFQKQRDEYIYDEKVLLSFLINNETLNEKYVQYVPQIRKQDIKTAGEYNGKDFIVNGEAVPGIIVNRREDKIVIKAK